VPVPTLLITGPGGVGKTTVAFEVCRQLEAGGVAHAMIDTDELDRIYPAPPGGPPQDKADSFESGGGVGKPAGRGRPAPRPHDGRRLPGRGAGARPRGEIPEARVVAVRLRASEDLLGRVRGREAGWGYEYQAPRTIEQSRRMAREPAGGQLLVETSGRSVVEVAREVLARAGWAPS
jgi:DNA polymerase III delta prime subunit